MVFIPMADVSSSESFRYQTFHRLANQFGSVITEKALNLGVEFGDLSLTITHDDGIGRELEQ